MKITPVTGPGAIQDSSTPEAVRTARAVEAFNRASQGQAQEHPVADANNISVEELGAIKAPTAGISDKNTEVETLETADTSEVQEDKAPKDPELERRFAQIARQERALRAKAHQQNQTFKQREADLKAREAALGQPAQPDLSNYISKDRVKQDALSVLEEAGVSWDELTNQVVNRQPTDPRVNATISRLEAKIAQLEEANQNTQKSYTEQQQANYQAAVKQIRLDATNLVNTDPEFETVKAMNAVKDVVELIEKTFQKDGVVLSVEEAAKEVENYLIEEAMKVTQIEKIKKRMAAANASRQPTDTKTQNSKQPQLKTLTNATSSIRPLTARERAIAAAEGRLKP